MKNNKLNKALLTGVLTTAILTSQVSIADAYVGPSAKSYSEHITHWTQWGIEGTSSYKIGIDNLNDAGCGWFSATYALIKSGLVPSDFNPTKLIEPANTHNGILSGSWVLRYDVLPKMLNNPDIKGISDKDLEESGLSTSWMNGYGVVTNASLEEGLKIIKFFYDRGYYIVPCLRYEGEGRSGTASGAHYVFIDYLNPDNDKIDFSIMDSAYEHRFLSDYKSYQRGTLTFAEIWVMDLSGGKESNKNFNMKSSWEDEHAQKHSAKGTSTTNRVSASEIKKIASSADLTGMDLQGVLSRDQTLFHIEEPIRGVAENKSIQDLKTSIDANASQKTSFLDAAIFIVGLALLIYSVVLGVVYFVFANQVENIMPKLLFGKNVQLPNDNTPVKGTNTVSRNTFIRSIAILAILSVLILTGIIQGWVLDFIELIS